MSKETSNKELPDGISTDDLTIGSILRVHWEDVGDAFGIIVDRPEKIKKHSVLTVLDLMDADLDRVYLWQIRELVTPGGQVMGVLNSFTLAARSRAERISAQNAHIEKSAK